MIFTSDRGVGIEPPNDHPPAQRSPRQMKDYSEGGVAMLGFIREYFAENGKMPSNSHPTLQSMVTYSGVRLPADYTDEGES